MASTGHHVEENGADKCPERWATTVSLANPHQWGGEVAAHGGGAPASSRNVVNGPLEGGEEHFCHRLREAKVSEHQDCNTVGNSIAAAPGVVHGNGQGMACLATDVTKKHLVRAWCVDGTVSFVAAVFTFCSDCKPEASSGAEREASSRAECKASH